VAWRGKALLAVHLPDVDDQHTRARLREQFPEGREEPPPKGLLRALEALRRAVGGEAVQLQDIVLDLSDVPPFHRRVYELARSIPAGRTMTYGEVAQRLGVPGAARAVGQALRRNPCAVVVPCHRVLAAGGQVGGFTAVGGTVTKLRLLAAEGVELGGRQPLFSGRGRFQFDPARAVRHLRRADAELGRLMDAVGPFAMGLQEADSLFAALTEAIVHQQLTARAAQTIHGRLRALFPRTPAGPSPKQILRSSEEKLLGAGLSRAKCLALRDLAARTERGELPTLEELAVLSDEAAVERLTVVRGVGRWTVEMLLMFRLGRADVLPLDDYGIRKGFARVFGDGELPSARQLAARGERWRPYRTVASWYLWRALELPGPARL
jgi:methylated-DNA-[protein]-cysteine S-methyltransferase